jgi:hypothetical protein
MKFQIFRKSKQIMGPKAKKMKLNENKVNLDPLERIHSDLHNLIFQHLKGKEVKKLSEVVTDWYLKLGSSKVAMSKIQLSLAVLSKKSDEALFTSQRRYSNFDFLCHNNAVQRFNILKAFAESLEHLEVKQVVKNFHELVPDANSIEFPKLKSLMVAANRRTKGQLKFAQMILDKSNKEEFRTIHIANYTPNILKMVFEMPKLKYLGIDFLYKSPINNQKLPVNESVTAAAINSFDPNLKGMIDLLPNIEEIEIGYISKDQLKIVAENSPKLKRCFYKVDFNKNILETYEELKLANPLINQNIELVQKPKGFHLLYQN